MTSRLWMFAGPNGAGKTTLVRRLVGNRLPVVNPDEFVDSAGTAGQLAAGRKAFAARERHLTQNAAFAVETTLSGRTEIDLIDRARRAGYRINLVYIGLAEVALSIARVSARVAGNGHDVPISDLLRRFDRSLAGLNKLAPDVDRLILIDNSATIPRLLLWRDGVRIRRQADDIPAWAAHAFGPSR